MIPKFATVTISIISILDHSAASGFEPPTKTRRKGLCSTIEHYAAVVTTVYQKLRFVTQIVIYSIYNSQSLDTLGPMGILTMHELSTLMELIRLFKQEGTPELDRIVCLASMPVPYVYIH